MSTTDSDSEELSADNSDLSDLKIKKKEVEIKLKLLKSRFEDELSSSDNIKAENILKTIGGKEYVNHLKDTIKTKDDTIRSLEKELETRRAEVKTWREKFEEAEKQCNVYYKAWTDSQANKVQLEHEMNDSAFERRLMNQTSVKMGSTASDLDVAPPPPPIEIPSMAEILQAAREPTNSPTNSFRDPHISFL